jgi:tRNA pseudouridine55 synthase
MHGVLNLLKPPGMTSHDAVAFVRYTLKEKRVGHTGTLDPAAAGVLPICVGQATRLAEYLQAGTKQYIAEATFGFETDTLDAVGQTIREAPTSQIDLDSLNAVLGKFQGEIEQIPPLYSAIKVEGQKLYDIGRAGGTIEIPKRKVTISGLEVTGFTPGDRPKAMFKIECSGGTYIRSLLRDIGKALGSAATMTFLVRSRSGAFEVGEAVSCEEFKASPVLTPIDEVLTWCARTSVVNDDGALTLFQGKLLKSPKPGELSNSENGQLQREHAQPPKNSILIHNGAKTLFALAVPSRETGFHRAEKVFDLRAG